KGDVLMELVYYYLIVVNIIGFAIMGRDKHLARKKQWRIPESTLLFFALIGGATGGTLGMYYFRHKTKHLFFKVGFPLISAVQIVVLALLL
ncbi:MAG: DUF1294 domain-containing protein, partial [Lachnospiraceae bacterium]